MFNLVTMVNALEKIGKAFPDVNTVVLSDIYKLNDNPSIDYSVFAIVQDQHRQDDDYFHFNFYLYYVDRLLNDKSNQLEIQSHGINLLSTVINKVEQLGVVVNTEFDRTYQVFNQRFSDECSGVYVRVDIQVPIDCTTPFDVLVDPLLGDITITAPGTYNPSDYGVDAFKTVEVEGGKPYIYYTESGTTAKIDNGTNNLEVNDEGVFINGKEVTTNNVLSAYTEDYVNERLMATRLRGTQTNPLDFNNYSSQTANYDIVYTYNNSVNGPTRYIPNGFLEVIVGRTNSETNPFFVMQRFTARPIDEVGEVRSYIRTKNNTDNWGPWYEYTLTTPPREWET